MITIALENPECSSRPTRATGSAVKGYIGNNMLTLFRKPEGGELLDWQKEFNKQINKIRYVIEQVICELQSLVDHAHRLPPTPSNIPETISAVVALHFYATA